MDSHAPLHNTPPTPVPPRVWQDVAAESLLCMAVVVIAMTGNNSVVLEINRWLAALIPAYDPMVTMLVVMIVVIAALILGSIGLKMSARRASEATGAADDPGIQRDIRLGLSPVRCGQQPVAVCCCEVERAGGGVVGGVHPVH